jgi:hypothetical protein
VAEATVTPHVPSLTCVNRLPGNALTVDQTEATVVAAGPPAGRAAVDPMQVAVPMAADLAVAEVMVAVMQAEDIVDSLYS